MTEPDLSFDIDALFEHMAGNLGHDPGDELDWVFILRSNDVAVLENVAQTLDDEFMVHVQETVETVDEDGNSTYGDPMLSVGCRGAYTAEYIKEIAERMGRLAAEHGLTYEGVECYEPSDLDEIFGWIEPDDAFWRLRHMTDAGLEADAELPWCFLILCPDTDAMSQAAEGLAKAGFEEGDAFDEPDEEGMFDICLFVAGSNNEAELAKATAKIKRIAERYECQLAGVQFYTREEFNDVFFGEDDDEGE